MDSGSPFNPGLDEGLGTLRMDVVAGVGDLFADNPESPTHRVMLDITVTNPLTYFTLFSKPIRVTKINTGVHATLASS